MSEHLPKKEHFPKYFFIFKGFQPKIGYNNLEFRKFAQGSKPFMLIRTKWELLLLYSNYFSILSFISWKSVCVVLSCVRSLKLKKWIVYWRSISFQRRFLNRFSSIIVTCVSVDLKSISDLKAMLLIFLLQLDLTADVRRRFISQIIFDQWHRIVISSRSCEVTSKCNFSDQRICVVNQRLFVRWLARCPAKIVDNLFPVCLFFYLN